MYSRHILYRVVAMLSGLCWGLVAMAASVTLPMMEGPASFPEDVIESFVGSGEKGVIFAVKGDPSLRASRLQRTFYVAPQTSFHVDVLLANFTAEPLAYVLVPLLDYRQVEMARPFDTPLVVQPGQRVEASLTLPSLEVGLHDLLVLAIRVISGQRGGALEYDVLSHRANVLVNASDAVILPVPTVPAHITENPFPADWVILNDSEFDSVTKKFFDDSSHPKQYFVHVANGNSTTERYAIVAFVTNEEGNQVSAAPRYVDVPGTSVVSVVAARSPLSGELSVVVVQNPFARLEPEQGSLASTTELVLSTNRIFIAPKDELQ